MKKQIVRVAFFLLLSFVLSLQVFAATEFEPNDTIETATPVEMEEEVFAELSAQDPADTDFYEFTVTKAGVITLTLDYDGTAAEDALSYYRVHIYNLASEYPVRTLTIVPFVELHDAEALGVVHAAAEDGGPLWTGHLLHGSES